jgi:ribonucleoside-diphosphate reductase alpha chain
MIMTRLLKPIEVHDMVCHVADAVLAGGIRRAALISLFSASDDEMIACKSGNWWETNPQRGRANNSVALLRHKITKDYFMDLWKRVEASGAGEPGICALMVIFSGTLLLSTSYS